MITAVSLHTGSPCTLTSALAKLHLHHPLNMVNSKRTSHVLITLSLFSLNLQNTLHYIIWFLILRSNLVVTQVEVYSPRTNQKDKCRSNREHCYWWTIHSSCHCVCLCATCKRCARTHSRNKTHKVLVTLYMITCVSFICIVKIHCKSKYQIGRACAKGAAAAGMPRGKRLETQDSAKY